MMQHLSESVLLKTAVPSWDETVPLIPKSLMVCFYAGRMQHQMEPIIKINFSTQNRFQHFPFTSVCLHLFMKIVRSNDSPFLSFFGASSTLTLLDLPLFLSPSSIQSGEMTGFVCCFFFLLPVHIKFTSETFPFCFSQLS